MKSIYRNSLILLFALIFCILFIMRIKRIDGSELGVKVSWSGVNPQPLHSGLTLYCPLLTKIYVANIGQQRFVMNNQPSSEEKHAHGREKDEFIVRSVDNQDMTLSVEVLWRRDPSKVIHQQSICNVDNDELFTENVIRQPVRNLVKNHLTVMKAIDAYSGVMHVKAQQDITEEIKADPELVRSGVIIDGFLLEVKLDDAYTTPIKNRQVAIQEQTAYVEQTKAAEAKALKAKADAQADLNTQVVAAQRDKEIAILKAQQQQETIILQAEGDKQRVILAGEASKAAAENEAAAIVAKGTATATSAKLLYSAYESVGGRTFASIEIAKQMAQAYSGVKGFVPESMKINVLAESFQKGVGLVIDGATEPNLTSKPSR